MAEGGGAVEGRCRRGGAAVVVEEDVRGRRLQCRAATAIDLTRFLLQARGWRGQVGRVSEQQLWSPVEVPLVVNEGPRRDPAIGPGMVFCTRTAVGGPRLLRLASVSRGCLRGACLISSLPQPACRSARAFHAPGSHHSPFSGSSRIRAHCESGLRCASHRPVTIESSSAPPASSSCLPTLATTVCRRAERARSAAHGWREMKSRESLFVAGRCDLRSLLPSSSPRRLAPYFLHSAFRTSSNT